MNTYTEHNYVNLDKSKKDSSNDTSSGTKNIYKSICFFSYNSRGFGEANQEVCKTLMVENDYYIPILCNQENFILHGNRRKVAQCLPGSKIYFKKAVKDSLHRGRAKNGMFIAIPKFMEQNTKNVSPDHWRLQALTLNMSNNKILVINSYFPTDPKIKDFDTDDLFSTLSAIQGILNDNSFDSVIWMGDINTDFSRNSQFTRYIQDFIDETSLQKSWDKYDVDYTHAYDIDGKTFTSTLDHFLWSENLTNSIRDAGVLHLPTNTSDHCPIFCKIDISSLRQKIADTTLPLNPKISSMKGTDEDRETFKITLAHEFETIDSPKCLEECIDVHCKEESHHEEIDNFLRRILDSITQVGRECFQKRKKSSVTKKQKIPLWQENIQPFKDTSMFWHAIWESAGRPINTELHNIMKRTRNMYHYQIRKGKKLADAMMKDSLIQACIDNNGDIFEIIRKARRTTENIPSAIDGISDRIVDRFADIYKKLYNSVEDEEQKILMRDTINKGISSSSLVEVNKITSDVVLKAINKLKNNKTDPVLDFNSDCLKNAPPALAEKLAAVFRYFLIHGHISPFLLLSSIIPLVKDKLGDATLSDNYRSIAVSSLILKIFDWVILILLADQLETDELQFGFLEKTSTSMCTWLMIETIEHYQRHGSDVYACVMDMTKAFDLVRHSKLFEVLKGKSIPDIYIRILLVMYEKQEANVRWNGTLSEKFSIKNGVKQGAVLSPRLYCVYTDGLFKLLRKFRTGCWMNGSFAGIVGYADDLLLLSPTIDGLQEMVKNCESYAQDHNLKFSTNDNLKKCKTKCIAFIKKDKPLKNIVLNGKNLPWVKNAKHLGCTITNDIQGLSKDIMEKRAQFINRANELEQEFSYAHSSTKIRLNQIFNTSFYGSQLWDLFSKEAERVEKTWNISQRIFLKIPRNSHRYFLEPLTKTQHIKFSLMKRFVGFVDKVINSSKPIMRNLMCALKEDCTSTTGKNLRRIMLMVNKDRTIDVTPEDLVNQVYVPAEEDNQWRIKIAEEIIEVKNRQLHVNNFTLAEFDDILDSVMT